MATQDKIQGAIDPAHHMESAKAKECQQFISLLTHDLRASVRALCTLPDWIEEDIRETESTPSQAVCESLNMMKRHARRLDQILVDLTTYHRIGTASDISSICVQGCLDGALSTLKPPATFNVFSEIETDVLWIDEHDLTTLLKGLISNAIKHHDRKCGNITIKVVPKDAFCSIQVFDDGVGIPLNMCAKVLAPLGTLKPRDEVEGSGMGLAIVDKITSVYGGRVEWQINPETGAPTLEALIPVIRTV